MIKEAVDSSIPHLRASVPWAQDAPEPLATLEARLAVSAAAFDADEAWSFTILDAGKAYALGAVGLEKAEPALVALVGSEAIETGYWLRADACGYGYATEAVAALTELAFTALRARRVAICHDPVNTASAGVPRRLGFRSVGIVPDVVLPGRQAFDGSIRPATMIWIMDAVATPPVRG